MNKQQAYFQGYPVEIRRGEKELVLEALNKKAKEVQKWEKKRSEYDETQLWLENTIAVKIEERESLHSQYDELQEGDDK